MVLFKANAHRSGKALARTHGTPANPTEILGSTLLQRWMEIFRASSEPGKRSIPIPFIRNRGFFRQTPSGTLRARRLSPWKGVSLVAFPLLEINIVEKHPDPASFSGRFP